VSGRHARGEFFCRRHWGGEFAGRSWGESRGGRHGLADIVGKEPSLGLFCAATVSKAAVRVDRVTDEVWKCVYGCVYIMTECSQEQARRMRRSR
jgi:hypothetical protein